MAPPVDVDVVIVGAGIAGMMGANVLAQQGRRVAVVEANHQAGGLMAGIWRKDFYFDVGDQSFESLGVVHPLLDQIDCLHQPGLDRVHHRIRGTDFDFPCSDFDTVRGAVMARVPPQHVAGMKGFLDELEGAIRRAGYLATWRTNPLLEKNLLGKGGAALRFTWLMMRHGVGFARDVHTRMDDMARKWGLPRDLCDTICAGYRRTSLFPSAGIWWAMFNDYSYPRGGMEALFNRMVSRVEERGGTMLYKRPVTRILVENGRATGVVTGKGEEIRARAVLYCADAKRLYQDLLGDHPVRSSFRTKVDKAPTGDAILSVYLGLDLPRERLAERMGGATHLFFFPENHIHLVEDTPQDPEAHRRSWLLMNAPCLHNPGAAPEGKSSLVIQAFTHASWLDRWGLGSRGDRARDPRYKELKKQVGAQILELALPVLPELKDKVLFCDVGSPQSAYRFTGNTDGSTVGWEFDPETKPFLGPGFRTRSEIPGLYTAGTWFCWPGGIPFSMLGAHQAAHQIHNGLGRTRARALLSGNPSQPLPAPKGQAAMTAIERITQNA